MKKLFVFLLICLSAPGLQAQITTPQPSPNASLEQNVGLTQVSIAYSRPSVRGRTIYGDLVPFDQIWRTGANRNTTITFSDDVTVGGHALKAGTYALYTRPGKDSWKVYFYTDIDNSGIPDPWEASNIAAEVTVKPQQLSRTVETLTIGIDDLSNSGATLGISWANTYAGVPFEVPTDEKAMKSIETVMNGPSAFDYYAAAAYYLEEGKDLQKAKEWIDKAAAMNEAFWILRRQALIYDKLGDRKGAIAAAKKSMAAAEAAGNQDYVKLNKDSLKEWGAL